MESRAQTAWDVIAWDVIGIVVFRTLAFLAFYAFSSLLAMVFWGAMASELGLPTMGYATALLATVGLWLVIGPMAWLVAYRVHRGNVIEF